MFVVNYYQLPHGEKPVKNFIDNLDINMRTKALGSIEILEKYGNKLREPYSKSMGNGIYELRIRFARDITRIFYFFIINKQIILTNGFIKKTDKTPPGEIALARTYKADYERRFKIK